MMSDVINQVIHDNFGIIEGLMTTVHAITGEFFGCWASLITPRIVEKVLAVGCKMTAW